MPALLELYRDQFLVFVLVLTRVGALVATAPILGARSVPMRIRAFLAVAMALLITPLQTTDYVEDPGNLVNLLVTLGSEAVLGLALGFGLTMLFAGIQITGQVAAQMSGMALADVFNPSLNTSVPVFSQLMEMVMLAVFLLIGGHRQVIGALLDTFRWTPPGSAAFSSTLVEMLVDVMTQSFILGVRAAAPIMVSVLLSVLIMGLISRTLPQLNVMAVGFSLNTIVMLSTLSITLGAIVWIFQEQADETIQIIRNAIASPPSP